jgi:hypothetical protein
VRARTLAALAVAAWAAAGPEPARAQDATVRAFVDRARVAEGDEVVLSIEIAAPSLGRVAPPDLSRLADFAFVEGPSSSSRFQWINGRTWATLTYSYVLRPRRVGRNTIPSLAVLVQGRTYRTAPIDLDVEAGGAARPPAGPGYGGPPGAPVPPPGAPVPDSAGPSQRPPAARAQDIRVRAEVDRRTAYVGQQVTVRFLLDTQTEILNLQQKESPSFQGFWAEEIKVPENLDMKRVQLDGLPYVEYTLMKRALFPTASGTLTIPSVAYQVTVRRRSQDPIEAFFFTPTETLTRRSEPIRIEVLPLPAAARPAGFSGAVGSFSLSVTADRREAMVNDAIGVKVRIAGEGNLDAVRPPSIPEISDFKRYEPKVSASSSMQGDRLRGEKTWDFVFIPLAPGTQSIPPVTFSFFDPRGGAYRTLTSDPIGVQVARGPEGAGASFPVLAQSDVRALRKDIHYIKLAPDGLSDRSRPFYRSPLFAVLVLLPAAADAGILLFVRRRDRLHRTARLRRDRRARALSRRRLRDARRRMTPTTARAFYAEVARALTEYVADKFDTAAAGLTHDRIEELLASRGAPPEARAAFHRALEACDYARFAPTSAGPAEMQRALLQAEESLVALERSLGA